MRYIYHVDLLSRLVQYMEMNFKEALGQITTGEELAVVLGKHRSTGYRIIKGDIEPNLEDIGKMLRHYKKLNYKMFL